MPIPRALGTILLLALPLLLGCGTRHARDEIAPPHSEVAHGPVRVSVQIEPARPRLSDRPKLTLTIDHASGVSVEKPPFGEAIGDFHVIDCREPLPKVENGREILTQICTLEPTRPGNLAIWPIDVLYTDARPEGDGRQHVLSTEPLSVEVTSSVAADGASLTALRPAAGPLTLPISHAAAIAAALAVLAALAAAVAGGWVWRRRRAARPPSPLSPAEIALAELQRILDEDLAHRDVKLFYIELTGIVRRFIERTTAIRAPEQTTEEFLREIALREPFSLEENRRLASFLEAADLVKFAAHRPHEEDIVASVVRAREFVGRQAQVATREEVAAC